ncbi:hypothetical protein TrRE_jg6768 [Triparma retinervis]|uniref:Major facilitator superfamily (MFS) profile domain-containing protein n=1 Tax=Triparma retinervis TaxID=2557542 RepID=A0A9W7AL14_9STRA|nr:hypothetical protein TrRE_jg6768 [Triparma retinervis]
MVSNLVQILLIYPPGVGFVGADGFYTMLIICRAIAGVSDGVLVMTFASLTDICDGDAAKLPIYYGKVGLVFGLAFTLGPLTAATLYGKFKSIDYVLYLSTAGATLACVMCFALPETLPAAKRRVFRPKFYSSGKFWLGLTPFDQLVYLTSSPLLMAYILPYFLHEISTAVYMSWILYFEWRFSWDITQVGIYISVVGIVVGAFQGLLLRPFTSKLKAWYPSNFEGMLIIWPAFVSAVHFALVGTASSGWMMFPLLVLTGIGSFMNPVMRGVVCRTQPPSEVGRVNAIFSTVGVLSTVGGNVVYPRLLKASEEGRAAEGR